ncbi:MAG TPA: DUF5693 family protein [Elusimicrobiota bacterium]|nr:DUF5693 family protein [Elusimicrobiota bacterium]
MSFLQRHATPLLTGLILLSVAASLPPVLRKIRFESTRTVELCVDGDDVWAAGGGRTESVREKLQSLLQSGVSSVSLYWNGTESLDLLWDRWSPAWPDELSITFRPQPDPFPQGNPADVHGGAFYPRISTLLCAGDQVWGYPDSSPLYRLVQQTTWNLPWIEFNRQWGNRALVNRFPERIIRAHSVDESEQARYAPAALRRRFIRAVKERGIRFLYLRLYPQLSWEENKDHLLRLVAGLQGEGFSVGPVSPPRAEFLDRGAILGRQTISFLVVVSFPLVGLFLIRRGRAHWILQMAVFTLITLAGSTIVTGLLSPPDFVLGLSLFRGVKAALLFPLVGAGLILYDRREIHALMQKPLTVKMAFFFLAVAAVMAIYLVRSGHDLPGHVSGGEQRFREMLEKWFVVRPRFKEFAFGHPLLILGLWLSSRRISSGNQGVSRGLILLGIVGQVSILNTFCHAHIPFVVSCVRTLNGLVLGTIGGGILIVITARLARRRDATTPS